MLGIYRKTHLFPTERLTARCDTPACGWSTPGNDPVVIQTPLASIGLSVCYDGDFPELFRAMAIMGAEVDLPADDADALLRDLGADQSGARL